MKGIKSFELPPELQKELHSAIKIEWITVFYLITVVIVMYLTMGILVYIVSTPVRKF